MTARIIKRLAAGAGLVLGVVTLTFLLINVAPGDPARLWVGPGAGPGDLDAARHALGLDRPLAIRYLTWLGRFVAGDWGTSLIQHRPVTALIAAALPNTVLLTATSLLLTYGAGVGLGALQAAHHRRTLDRVTSILSLIVYGMPAYWLAVLLVLVFVYGTARYGWPAWTRLPAMGVASLDADLLTPAGRALDRARHLVLPLLTLALIGMAGMARFARASILDVRRRPYVQAARARGLRVRTVEWRYIARNALIPIVTLLGLSLPALVSGTVFVEVIFAWPGMGREIVTAVASRDYPVVMATTAVFAVLVVLGNLLADVLATVVDPRTRRS